MRLGVNAVWAFHGIWAANSERRRHTQTKEAVMTTAPKEQTHGATGGVAITASDTSVIEPATRGVYIGAGGNVAVTWLDGTTTTMSNVPSGAEYGWQVTQILSTGTTASSIIALY